MALGQFPVMIFLEERRVEWHAQERTGLRERVICCSMTGDSAIGELDATAAALLDQVE